MSDKEILDHFMEQLTFHSVRYAGHSKEDDWHLVEISDILFLIDEEGYIVSYAKDIYLERLKCKYTEDYILVGGKLYYNEYTGSELKEIKVFEQVDGDIKDMIFYEETGLLELVFNDKSVLMYEGQVIDANMICYFAIQKNSVLTVCWKNEVLRLETSNGTYYMSKKKKRMYSSKSRRGKKLSKIFFSSAE